MIGVEDGMGCMSTFLDVPGCFSSEGYECRITVLVTPESDIDISFLVCSRFYRQRRSIKLSPA